MITIKAKTNFLFILTGWPNKGNRKSIILPMRTYEKGGKKGHVSKKSWPSEWMQKSKIAIHGVKTKSLQFWARRCETCREDVKRPHPHRNCNRKHHQLMVRTRSTIEKGLEMSKSKTNLSLAGNKEWHGCKKHTRKQMRRSSPSYEIMR